MPDHQVALKFYELALSQYLARVKQRDVVLLFYAAASGTVAGFALGDEATLSSLLLVPFLAGAAGVIMAYQSFFIEALAAYASEELAPELEGDAVPFLLSANFASLGMKSVILRTAGNFVILVVPAIAAGVVLCRAHDSNLGPFVISGSVALALLGASLLLAADLLHIRRVGQRYRKNAAVREAGRDVPAKGPGADDQELNESGAEQAVDESGESVEHASDGSRRDPRRAPGR